MDDARTYEGYKFEKGSVTKVSDPLTVEQALEIQINGKPFTVVMQTPGNEIELATGLLYAEDVIKANTRIEFEILRNKAGQIDRVNAMIPADQIGDGYLSSRSLLSVSSCGICGKQSLEDLPHFNASSPLDPTVYDLTVNRLKMMQETMFESQKLFHLTGGCHGVAAYDMAGKLLTLQEDIGRHNAMDKVVGALIQQSALSKAAIICFSGRVSYEIVSKAFRARIKVIIAVSAPSSLAIDFAKEYGIQVFAFARKGKFTCYANCRNS